MCPQETSFDQARVATSVLGRVKNNRPVGVVDERDADRVASLEMGVERGRTSRTAGGQAQDRCLDVDLNESRERGVVLHANKRAECDRALVQRGSVTLWSVFVAETLADGTTDDAKTGLALITRVEDGTESLAANTAHDTLAICAVNAAQIARVVVPVPSALKTRPPRNREISRGSVAAGMRFHRGESAVRGGAVQLRVVA